VILAGVDLWLQMMESLEKILYPGVLRPKEIVMPKHTKSERQKNRPERLIKRPKPIKKPKKRK